jgi:ABC-type nitrate/sulfonate/bicarbonate transport system ATPase subunit
MKYRKFIIKNYRAITGPLVIDVSSNILMPIIGINECGKTTILHALFSFDNWNDDLNDGGRHLRDTDNLYVRSPKAATVSAEIVLSRREFLRALDNVEGGSHSGSVSTYRRKRGVPTVFLIERNLKTRIYDIAVPGFRDAELNDALAREILKKLPYVLFFDDFRDSVDEKVEIVAGDDGEPEGWLSIFEQLFKRTDRHFSVFDLADMEERQRKTVLSAVKRKLNETLTTEWQNFRLDNSAALQISIDFYQEKPTPSTTRNYLRLDVIEKDSAGYEHFFFIRDRSKGFFWFFNFVMKLEFNPKVFEYHVTEAIYLLDEPGSYLHASAQSKLCKKLRQLSQNNAVIYCTHSHYLLDPDVIPLSSIRVAEKSDNGNVELLSIHAHKGSILERRSAFQPIVDALQIKPFLLDLTNHFVVIVEGICDFYALELFKGNRPVNFLPSVGAESIAYYISLMIAWRIEYRALWDGDAAGTKAKVKAEGTFGSGEAKGRFFDLTTASQSKAKILQDLFVGTDIALIKKRLSLPDETSFEKTIIALFYASNRQEVVNEISVATKRSFDNVFASVVAI